MAKTIFFLSLAAVICAGPFAAQQAGRTPDALRLERAKALLREVPLIDGHNDLATAIVETAGGDLDRVDLAARQPQLPADLPRLREGLVGGQFWAAWVPSDVTLPGAALKGALREVDLIYQLVARYPEFEFARTAEDIERIFRSGKIASLIGLEGGHMIENSLPTLRMFHQLGVRYMTLTHFRNTDWADSGTDYPRHGGLTEFGEEVVRELNRLGIFVDLSHTGPDTMEDAIRVSRAPVIFSHSNALAINAHPRNVPDHILTLVARNGGVVMVNFIAGYTPPTPAAWRTQTGAAAEQMRAVAGRSAVEPAWGSRQHEAAERLRAELDDEARIAIRLKEWEKANPAPRGTLEDVADHIDHIRKIAGVDHVGIGSDFYTAGASAMAEGLEDVSRFPFLIAELLRRGYSDDDIKKIAGLNLLRAMREMERVASTLQLERRPSSAEIKR